MDIIYIYKLINENDCKDIEKYRNLAQVITRTICQRDGMLMLDLYGVELFKVNKKFSCECGMVLSKGDYCLVGKMSSHNADPQRGCRTNEEWDAISCEYDEMPDFVYEDEDNKYLEKVTDFEFPQFPAEPFGTNNFLTIYQLIGQSTINIKRYSEEDFTDFPDHLQVFRKFVTCKKVEEIKSVENISGFVEFIVDKYEKEYGTVDPEISLVIGVIGRESFFWECGIWYHKGSDGTIVCAALEEFAPGCYSLPEKEPRFGEDSILFQKSYELPENWAEDMAELKNAILALEEDSFDDDSDDDSDDDFDDDFDDELSEWVDHLKEHPEDAEECDKWDEFDGEDWSRLLENQPQFADKCDKWDEFDGEDWSRLLGDQPQFADKCDKWDEFDGGNWSWLLKDQPQFADKCDKWDEFDGEDWSWLLENQPQFAEKCDKWDEIDGGYWGNLLQDQPQFADKCDWSKLEGGDWRRILGKQPQFADKCDKWDEFYGRDWSFLLRDQPQFADKCDKWDEINGWQWRMLLGEQPQFTDKCDKWDEFDGRDWSKLLGDQPQFADKCDWSKLNVSC